MPELPGSRVSRWSAARALAEARTAAGESAVDIRDHATRVRAGVVVVPPLAATEGAGEGAGGQRAWRHRFRRFLFGFTLPFVIGNACLHHPLLGPPAQKILRRQAVITFVVGVLWFWLVDFEDIHFDNGGTISISSGATGLAAFLGALAVVEWCVIALSREHHDKIGADVARLLGIPPDEDVVDPRIRLNATWMWTKLKRRAQGVLVMLVSVAPSVVVAAFFLLLIVPFLDELGGLLLNVVVALVIYYWIAVIAIGKTSWAWRHDIDREPLPLRIITVVGARSRWLLPFRLWAWSLRKSMALIVRPARHLEHLPWEGAGLALARVVMGFPVVYVVMRPFFPVAATLLLTARAPHLFDNNDAVPVPPAASLPVPFAAGPFSAGPVSAGPVSAGPVSVAAPVVTSE